jgi:hypothetical protein
LLILIKSPYSWQRFYPREIEEFLHHLEGVKEYLLTASGKIQKYKLKEIGVKMLTEAGVELV